MKTIATPDLNPVEWTGVRQALGTVADCGCGDPPPAGSVRHRLSRAIGAIAGHKQAAASLSPEQRILRDFLCASGRSGRIAEDHVPALSALGYNRPQIEAMALIAA
ncbi:MAG TPA: hypothetical protein VF475_02515 [Sphingobium sp.]